MSEVNSSMEIFKDLFPLEDRWGKDGVFTPTNIVKDMIDLLPDSIWKPESTFIDISCKTAAFLVEIYTRLDTELSKLDEYKDPIKRRSHILNNQLFGLALRNDESLFFSRRNVFGDPFSDNIDVINAGNSSYLDLVKQKSYDTIETQLKGKFGRMKFDVVVGNPPYNNDIYLDFVTFGHHLSTQYTLMITPAKWQAKTDGKPAGSSSPDKNVEFRKNIVPFMSKIVYYPCTEDLFDIREVSGISYYLMNKQINSERLIKIVCKRNSSIKSNWEIHDEKIPQLCNIKILNVLGKMGQLGFKRFTYTSEQDRGEKLKQAGYVEIMQGSKVCGYKSIKELFTTDRIEKYKVTTSCMAGNIYLDDKGKTLAIVPCNILKPYQVPKGSFPVIKYFETYRECENFKSFYESKLISFCFYFGACGSTLTREFFRFVPNPNDWTVTYVDKPHQGVVPDEKGYYEYNGVRYCSLYVRYKLSKEDTDIIESIIKARK